MSLSDLSGKLETDVEIKAPAAKFHEVFTHRPHHISNVSSTNVQGCDLHDGEWGTVGSVLNWNYFHDGQAKFAKELIEAIDTEKNTITFRVIEGEILDHYKSYVATLQVTPKSDVSEGSIVHWTIEYEKHHDDIADPHTLIQFLVDITKDIDAHLVTTTT